MTPLLLRVLVLLPLAGAGGCRWSFQTVSLSPEVKTISVQMFPNNAGLVVPSLGASFTESLRDQFLRQTRLNLVEAEGDLQLSGSIVDYRIDPITVTQGDQAAQNRLSMAVAVVFENRLDPSANWNQRFTSFADFAQSANLAAIEQELIAQLNQQLAQDIFNKALGNW